MTMARITPPCVTHTTGSRGARMPLRDLARGRQRALGHLGVRLALLASRCRRRASARSRRGSAPRTSSGREAQPFADVDLAPACVEGRLEARCARDLLRRLARARQVGRVERDGMLGGHARGERLGLGPALGAERRS